MNVIEIKDWAHFTEIAEKRSAMGPEGPNIFRGQENAEWSLRPSLTRLLVTQKVDIDRALELERKALTAFQQRAHLAADFCRDIEKNDELSWWEIMQHYGAPTRLLDWTKSPYIALYHTVENLGRTGIDGALFLFDAGHLNYVMEIRHGEEGGASHFPFHQFRRSLAGEKYEKCINVIGNPRPTDRMVAQQSSFTVCTELLEDHDKFADSFVFDGVYGGEGHSIVTKYIVKGKLKTRFLANLEMMNITASALFPGIDGLGKSIKEMVEITVRRGSKKAT